MSGRDEGRGMENARTWLRGVLIIVVIAALTGLLGGQGGLKRASLSALNLAGLGVMLLGLAAVLCARALSNRADPERREAVSLAIKLIGVGVCGVGAILVFI